MSHAALPPPDATSPLGFHRVLPEVVHGNALLHLLLPGGNARPPAPSPTGLFSGTRPVLTQFKPPLLKEELKEHLLDVI